MKYVQKRPEPEILTNWRESQLVLGVNCRFDQLKNPQKQIVYQALWDDQGWICCYCCQRITEKLSHVEHFDPQGKTQDGNGNNPLSVTYSNLLASCGPLPEDPNDPKKRRRFPNHCGAYRKDNLIPISPLDPACESYFVYNINTGEIEANLQQSRKRQQEAEQTIKILNLNDSDLIRMRLAALESVIEIDMQDPQEAVILLESYSQKQLDADDHPRFPPFCVTIAYYLRTEFNLP